MSSESQSPPDASSNASDGETNGPGEEAGGACDYHSGEPAFDPADRDRPVLVWDGNCGFCARCLERLQDQVGDRILTAPYQKIHPYIEGLGPSDFERSVHLVEPDGSHYTGAEAIFRALSHGPGRGAGLWTYEHLPGFATLTEGAYRWVANHRPAADRWSRRLIGEDLRPSNRRIARWLFLRLLGLVFVIAFLSFALQVDGLIGSDGISPAAERLDRVRRNVETQRPGGGLFWTFPTLFAWLEPTDGLLQGVCIAGSVLGGLLVIGVWPRLLLAVEWVLYLTMIQVGGVFFGYQWDALLLEAGLLAVVLAPSGLFPRGGEESPSGPTVFLFRWLLFRLMFMSGVVKLLSGDPTWWDGTALTYHFWTQPLPTWTGYYVHHLPDLVLVAGTYATLVLELAVPFLIFGPRRLQRWAAVLIAGLQGAILATGNYCFFNLLALALCLLLIDDREWRRWMPRGLVERLGPLTADPAFDPDAPSAWRRPIRRYGRWARRVGMGLLVVGVVGVTGLNMMDRFQTMGGGQGVVARLPAPVQSSMQWLSKWRSFNNYGLFANMTTDRPELIVQGSRDGQTWKTYRFKWKPDDLDDRPRFVEPHQPRFDWQMWFQALRQQRAYDRTGRCGASRWFLRFQKRLLQGSGSVEALLERVPFDTPPRYVRAVMYRYEYTKPGAETERWWRRTRLGQYCPTLTLRNGQLAAVRSIGRASIPEFEANTTGVSRPQNHRNLPLKPRNKALPLPTGQFCSGHRKILSNRHSRP